MLSKLVSATAVVLAASSLVSAQTHSDCNPVKGDKCKADPAFGGTVTIDFTKGPSDEFTLASGTSLNYDKDKGAIFSIEKDGQAPTITSNRYLFFGRVDVTVMVSFGTGVVTSSVLQSDDLDEIDWEWLGGDTAQVQTNYFSKGDDSTYDRGGFSPVANPQTTWHTYSIDWTPQKIDWIIDGNVVRTLTYSAAKGGATFPQTPMQVKLGTWVAGSKNAPQGTVTWAGGYTNFADGPFLGYYKSVTITDYSNGVKGATSYTYGDSSGTFGSIKVSTDPNGTQGAANSTSTSTKASTSSTASSSTTLSSATKPASTTGAGGSGSGSGSSATITNSQAQNTKPASSGIKTPANLAAVGGALLLSYLVL